MNWILVMVGAIILLTTAIGWYKGLIKMLMSVGMFVVSILISLVIAPYVNQWLCEYTTIDEKITIKCEETIGSKLESMDLSVSDTGLEDSGDVINGINDYFEKTLNITLPERLAEEIEEKSRDTNQLIQDAQQSIATSVCATVMKWGSFLITTLVIYMALFIVFTVLDVVAKLPVICGFNKFTGALLGSLQGLLFVWILFFIIECFAQVGFFADCHILIEQSKILQALYKYNIISALLLR